MAQTLLSRVAGASMLASVLIGLVASGGPAIAQPAPDSPAPQRPDTPPRAIPPLPSAKPIVGEFRFGQREARARHPQAIRIATYNVENLFDQVDDPALSGDQDDMPMAKPESQCRAIAAAIRTIDADVIALEEIESKDALIWFRDAYLSDLGYSFVESIDAGDDRGIENGVLSRFPLSNVKTWVGEELGGVHPATYGDRGAANWFAGQPLEFRRTPLRVDVQVPAGTDVGGVLIPEPLDLTLFVVHHKSGRGSEYWREAEAAKITQLIKEAETERPGRKIALLGDFNAAPGDRVLSIYRDAGMVDTLAHRATAGADAAAFTTHASERTIDYILVNAALASELVPESAFVFGTLLLPEGVDYRDVAPPEGYGSDHMPVCVEIRVSEEGAKAKVGE